MGKCEQCGASVKGRAYCEPCMAALLAEDSRKNCAVRFHNSRHVIDEGCPYCGMAVCRCNNADCKSIAPKPDAEKAALAAWE